MSMQSGTNVLDYYRHLRQYQLHVQKRSNPQTNVPTHQAFKPTKPNIQRLKEYQRNKRIESIQRQNQHIMNKLVNINKRKSEIAKSSPNLTLPKIIKQISIPLFQEQNNYIAKRIIDSKSSINTLGLLQKYRSVQTRKRNISKYHNYDGTVINRKKYVAQLLLLKKMRVSEVLGNSK